jgi:hypothetical protein
MLEPENCRSLSLISSLIPPEKEVLGPPVAPEATNPYELVCAEAVLEVNAIGVAIGIFV